VFFRYVLNESCSGRELVRAAMLWGIMLSAALVGHRAPHPGRLARITASARGRGSWSDGQRTDHRFSLMLLWAGIQFVDRTWMQQSPVLDVPKWTSTWPSDRCGMETLLMLLTWNAMFLSPTN